MIAWISILLASLCETLWASSLKFLNFRRLKIRLKRNGFFSQKFGIAFLPLCTYIIFGILNMVFLTMALKTIPLAICYAVWMGLALILQTLIDVFYFKENISLRQLGFLLLILIGIIGLQFSSQYNHD
jgi:quaternary ammonium compound-resistance protein SugE